MEIANSIWYRNTLSVQSVFPRRRHELLRRDDQAARLRQRRRIAVGDQRLGEHADEGEDPDDPRQDRAGQCDVSHQRHLLQGQLARAVRSRADAGRNVSRRRRRSDRASHAPPRKDALRRNSDVSGRGSSVRRLRVHDDGRPAEDRNDCRITRRVARPGGVADADDEPSHRRRRLVSAEGENVVDALH